MAVEIKNCETPLENERLTACELRFRILLPMEYRAHLLTYNGGRPEPAVFRFEAAKGRVALSCVDWFLAVCDGEHDNFETYFVRYKLDGCRVPIELVPIAHDPGGNLICIATKGHEMGAVYFWDHEDEGDVDEILTYRNVHLIARSFNDFMNSFSK